MNTSPQNIGALLRLSEHSQFLRHARDEVEGERLTFIFEQLMLPFPTTRAEISFGTTSLLVPLNPYGLILRIEEPESTKSKWVRINNSPSALKPLLAMKAGFLVFEICPGIHACGENDLGEYEVARGLAKDGYFFDDQYARNAGRIPIVTPDHPNGMAVTFDRMSAKRQPQINKKLKSFLPRFCPQDIFYEELTDLLKRAWPDLEKPSDKALMQEFWQKCRQWKEQGRLIDGWNKHLPDPENPSRAESIAAKLADRARAYEAMHAPKLPGKQPP